MHLGLLHTSRFFVGAESDLFLLPFLLQHDPDTKECSPGGRAGNYVMFTRAGDGTQPNNFLFSPCSKREMSPIIVLKGSQCFISEFNKLFIGEIFEIGILSLDGIFYDFCLET